ncbi:MAG: exodeoxyribonuclease VII small subunit [Gammaproteobacteria bacterium]|nr:exodeoxyribonuclease VII small subunit [Gammaproteobacteria bacterium]
MPQKKSPPDFEKALSELEQLVERLEHEEASLESSLKDFERGIQLTQACQKALDEAEQKIQKLTEENGEFRLEPFADDDPLK